MTESIKTYDVNGACTKKAESTPSSSQFFGFLGGSGVQVSKLCLGTATFGEDKKFHKPGQCDEETAHKILDSFVSLGGNFIDTANYYQCGESETIVGCWLRRQQREKIVLATKVRFDADPSRRLGGLSRRAITYHIEESLRRLQTHYIDLYQIHAWDSSTPLQETVRTLDDLVRCGKVLYTGASNVTGWQFQKIMDYCQFLGMKRWVTLQTQYNLINRDVEWELLDACKNEAVGILPFSPLKGGWLTGKVKRGDPHAPSGSRIAFAEATPAIRYKPSHPCFSQYKDDEQVWTILDTVESIAFETGKTMSQVSLRWLVQKECVSSVIFGCKNVEQLKENMGAASGWKLSTNQMKRLDDASDKDLPELHREIKRMNGHKVRASSYR